MTTATEHHTHMPIDEMEAIWRGGFKRARASLGVSAFGMAVNDLPPNFDRVPAHVHTFDDQEEVYVTLEGAGWLEIDGERVPIDTETVVRVGPAAARRPISGPEGLRLLAIGGVPGRAYEPFPNSETGAPEPDLTDLPGVRAASALAADAGHEPSHDFTAAKIGDMTRKGGYFKGVTMIPIRRELGVTAFGIGLIEIEPVDDAEYPLHNHLDDGQEEVFIPISGDGEIEIEDVGRVPLHPGEMIRVAPRADRKINPGPNGIRVVIVGGTPGMPYAPPRYSA